MCIHKRFALRLLTLLLISITLAACSGAAQSTAAPTQASAATAAASNRTPASTPMDSAEFDQMFIDMMVPHHESAMAMAEIALDRAEHPEIKTMAEDMKAKQQAEIDELTTWRQTWYGSSDTPPMSAMPMLPGMSGPHDMMTMDMTVDIERLRNAAAPFDLAFIDAMNPHHQMAVMAAQLALEQANHPEIATMAQQIIDDQNAEIEQMQNWRTTWYPDAAPMATATSMP